LTEQAVESSAVHDRNDPGDNGDHNGSPEAGANQSPVGSDPEALTRGYASNVQYTHAVLSKVQDIATAILQRIAMNSRGSASPLTPLWK
jgi:hypothetical protein